MLEVGALPIRARIAANADAVTGGSNAPRCQRRGKRLTQRLELLLTATVDDQARLAPRPLLLDSAGPTLEQCVSGELGFLAGEVELQEGVRHVLLLPWRGDELQARHACCTSRQGAAEGAPRMKPHCRHGRC